jgi:hypothetical protein
MKNPIEYWYDKCARRGFETAEFIGTNTVDIRAIEPWYRYNTFLYVPEKALDRIPPTVRRMQLRRDEPIADLPQFASRLGNPTFGYLPQPFVPRIASLEQVAVRIGMPPN